LSGKIKKEEGGSGKKKNNCQNCSSKDLKGTKNATVVVVISSVLGFLLRSFLPYGRLTHYYIHTYIKTGDKPHDHDGEIPHGAV
jgi:hypothetical protein